ncbi:MAG: hypothetical protein SF187_01305 [Deltaproteobacteria bacterium]|nr:hypothetical protein [Deltaproteobacteria bacterium]
MPDNRSANGGQVSTIAISAELYFPLSVRTAITIGTHHLCTLTRTYQTRTTGTGTEQAPMSTRR